MMPGPSGRPPSKWKTWHKGTLAVLGVLALCLCGVAVFAPDGKPDDTRKNTTEQQAAALAGSVAPDSGAPAAPAAAGPATTGPATTSPAAGRTSPASRKPAAKPVYYANCDAVEAAGKAPLSAGQPGYRRALDRDGDGVACEPYDRDDPPPADPGDDPPAGDEPGGGTDPRFSSCAKAIDAGYGPYRRGVDPEYAWYTDRDKDGVVCES